MSSEISCQCHHVNRSWMNGQWSWSQGAVSDWIRMVFSHVMKNARLESFAKKESKERWHESHYFVLIHQNVNVVLCNLWYWSHVSWDNQINDHVKWCYHNIKRCGVCNNLGVMMIRPEAWEPLVQVCGLRPQIICSDRLMCNFVSALACWPTVHWSG